MDSSRVPFGSERSRVFNGLVNHFNTRYRPKIDSKHEELFAESSKPYALVGSVFGLVDRFASPRGTENNPNFSTEILRVPNSYNFTHVQLIQTINNPEIISLVGLQYKGGKAEIERILYAFARLSDEYFILNGAEEIIASEEELSTIRGWVDFLDEQYKKKVRERADNRFEQVVALLLGDKTESSRPSSIKYRILSNNLKKIYSIEIAGEDLKPSESLPIAYAEYAQREKITRRFAKARPTIYDVVVRIGNEYIVLSNADIDEIEPLLQSISGRDYNVEIAMNAIREKISKIAILN